MLSPEDQKAADALDALGLPDFPYGSLIGSQEAARNAYLWAKLMLDTWGSAAATRIHMAMTDSLRENDRASFEGWNNISVALAEFARVPAASETVH